MDQTMRTIFPLALLLCGSPTVAQVWCPPSAVWRYNYDNNFNIGVTRIAVVGDTVLLGQTCSVLEKTVTGYSSMTNELFVGSFGTEITFAANDMVWLYVPETNAFDTLFNLNAVPGDTWQFADRAALLCGPESKFLVTDTGTMVLQGSPLRWLSVDIYNIATDFTIILQDTIIEQIGPIGTYLLPHDLCNAQIDGGQGGALRCYSDTDISYTTDVAPVCDFTTGLRPEQRATDFAIFPNPGSDVLHVTWPGCATFSVHLLDGIGRVVTTSFANSGSLHVETRGLAPGCYAVEAHAADGTRSITKWIKQ
jgi:hypothetical protein